MTSKNIIYYCVPYVCPESFYKLKTIWDISEDGEIEYIASEAAEDYYDNHDGWETHWPVEITLHEQDGSEPVCKFEVELTMIPSFHAIEIEGGA